MSPTLPQMMANAANEGIPVCAIARITATPADEVYHVLNDAKAVGSIIDVPKADWPPGSLAAQRLPLIPLPSDDDLAFMCRKAYKFTALEGAFMVSLLKNRQVEKTRLHNVIEQQRLNRGSQPNDKETTDPKMVDVVICKLRKKLKLVDKDLKIETNWGGGYYVEPDMKPRIIAHAMGEDHAHAPEETTTNGNPTSAVH